MRLSKGHSSYHNHQNPYNYQPSVNQQCIDPYYFTLLWRYGNTEDNLKIFYLLHENYGCMARLEKAK